MAVSKTLGGGGIVGPGPSPRIVDRLRLFLLSPSPLIVLYAILVFLWFREDIPGLRGPKISPLFALVPLAGILAYRLFRRVGRRRITGGPSLSRKTLAAILLVALAAAVRLPFLPNGEGMMNSDDAIPALMGKHIAEGEIPPINFYGQDYLGSFPSHVYALFFFVFGYSIFVLKIATLLAYLGFVALVFLFLADLVPWGEAAAISAFFVLPIGHLILISYDNSAAFGFVLLFGAAILYAARAVVVKNSAGHICWLGFLMGLAFWTNQATASFILTAVLYIAWQGRLRLKTAGILAGTAAIGALPLIFQEIGNRFQIIAFLFGGEKGGMNTAKLQATGKFFQSLLSPQGRIPLLLIGLFVLAGVAALTYRAVRTKGRDPASLLLLFTLLFSALYFYSRFSDRLLVRYLYPFYVVLPALLMAPILLIRSKLKFVLISGLLAGILLGDNVGPTRLTLESARKGKAVYLQIIEAMSRTGRRYWQGNYWVAYLFTALSGEKVIVDSFTSNRYPAYRLAYDNDQASDNYVLVGNADTSDAAFAYNLGRLLTKFDVPHQMRTGPDWSLFYGISGPAFPVLLMEDPPPEIPRLDVREIHALDGFLHLTFSCPGGQAPAGFRIHVEIPGYSSAAEPLPPRVDSVTVALPFPVKADFPVRYYLDYQGLPILSAAKEFSCRAPGPAARAAPFVPLRGLSAPMLIEKRMVRLCDREASFEVRVAGGEKDIRIVLNSPFKFSDTNWHARFKQSVKIRVGEQLPVDRDLEDGPNIVDIALGAPLPDPRTVRIEMDFRYQFYFGPSIIQKVSAILENIPERE